MTNSNWVVYVAILILTIVMWMALSTLTNSKLAKFSLLCLMLSFTTFVFYIAVRFTVEDVTNLVLTLLLAIILSCLALGILTALVGWHKNKNS